MRQLPRRRRLVECRARTSAPSMRMGSCCLPAREGAVVLHSRLRFLSSRKDECTGNGEPGAIDLGSLGLESDALGSPSALWARDRDNQLFRGLGRRRVRAETACRTFDRLDSGDGRDYLVDDSSCSRRRQLGKACRTSRNFVAGARTRSCTASERISCRG